MLSEKDREKMVSRSRSMKIRRIYSPANVLCNVLLERLLLLAMEVI